MNRKLTIIFTLLVIFYGLGINAPIVRATAFVFDIPTEISTGIQAGSGVAEVVREYILKPIVRVIARNLLNKLSSSIITEIQGGGRGGGPAFVQNWTQFQTQAQHRGENTFLAELKNSHLCGDFSNSIKAAFGVRPTDYIDLGNPHDVRTNSLETYGLKTNCTLLPDFDMKKYQKDFSCNGGWDTWNRLLEPQNNYYGVLFASLDEVAKQRSLAENGALHEAAAGSGYTSIRAPCQDRTLAPGEQGPIQQSSETRCVFMGEIFTPGDLLGKSAASTIDNELGWITSSTEIASLVIDVTSAVINRLGNSLGGLATANTAGDYANAPSAGDSATSDEYFACINSCPSGTDVSCQMQCAQDQDQGYNPPSSSCTVDITSGEVTCTSATPLCINSPILNILKTPILIPQRHPGPGGDRPRILAFKDAVPAWAAINKKVEGDFWDHKSDAYWFVVSVTNTKAPLNAAREALASANDYTQIGNDSKIKALAAKIDALASWVNSAANDDSLIFHNQRDRKLVAVYHDYDALVGEPDCATLPPPTTTILPTSGGGGRGLTCKDAPTAKACLSTTQHHPSLVMMIKNYLISENINITGYCGAFEITKRVAWVLRGEGVGLLHTNHKSQCNGFAAGNIAYWDNSGADILGDVGGANTPMWDPGPSQNESGVYYAAPIDPGDPEGSY